MTALAQRRQIRSFPDNFPKEPNYGEKIIDSSAEPGTDNDDDPGLETCIATDVGALATGSSSRMVIKRSLSPDGHIDSVSVKIDLSIDGLSAQAIRAKGLKALALETEIIQSHFAGDLPSQPLHLAKPPAISQSGNGVDSGEGPAVPARLLDIGRTRNNHYFINVKVSGKMARLFGSPVQLVRHLAGIGHDLTPAAISEGLQLDFSCRAITKLSDDGRYLNVIRLLPTA
jgi:hypothetical protein